MKGGNKREKISGHLVFERRKGKKVVRKEFSWTRDVDGRSSANGRVHSSDKMSARFIASVQRIKMATTRCECYFDSFFNNDAPSTRQRRRDLVRTTILFFYWYGRQEIDEWDISLQTVWRVRINQQVRLVYTRTRRGRRIDSFDLKKADYRICSTQHQLHKANVLLADYRSTSVSPLSCRLVFCCFSRPRSDRPFASKDEHQQVGPVV